MQWLAEAKNGRHKEQRRERKKNDITMFLSLTCGIRRVLESEEDRSCLDGSYTIMKQTRQIINRGSE